MIIRNRARCKLCNTIVESKTVHDFQACKCGKMFVDGGKEYIRRGGWAKDIEELSETRPDNEQCSTQQRK